ncbi:TetR/AcrR family transcriptional regulator [Oxalobacteraceae bacterium]|nr:TetR/AcrR family transcriptional regulator [Oxalobacteraceae bacterium]
MNANTDLDALENSLDTEDCVDLALPCGAEPPCGSKSAGRPRAADQEARLQNLLTTAGGLFLQKGYSKVSLEMIARAAHVAVRTIYVKFGGKTGLLNAVIAAGRARHFADMSSMETDDRPIKEVLGDFSLRFLRLVMMPSFVSLHRMVIAEANSNPELATTFNQAGPKQTRELLGRYFNRPEVRAQLRTGLDAETLAMHLLNCIMGDQLSRLLFEPEHPPTEEETRARVAKGLELFCHGVLR